MKESKDINKGNKLTDNQEELLRLQEQIKVLKEVKEEQEQNYEDIMKLQALEDLRFIIDVNKKSWTSEDINSLIAYIQFKEEMSNTLGKIKDVGIESLDLVFDKVNDLRKSKTVADSQKAFSDFVNSLTSVK